MPRLKYGSAVRFAFVSLLAGIAFACSSARSPADYGAACGAGTACGGDLLCVVSDAYPGGYCSRDCSASPCGAGAVCDDAMSPALCLRECETHADCRDGYQCWRGACRPGCDRVPSTCGGEASCGPDGRCVGPECVVDGDCGAGRRCDMGSCVVPPPPVDGGGTTPAGEPCTGDATCASGVCLPADRGGVCSDVCSSPPDCIAVVDFDAACAPVSRGGTIQTLCVPYDASGATTGRACTADAQCASSTCVAGQCTEACGGAEDCLLGQTCTNVPWGGGAFRGCGYASGSGVSEIALGDHDLTAGFGTPELVFATPPDSVSVTLRVQTLSGDPLPLSFYDVEDPRGTTIFLLDDIYALRDPPDRWIPGDSEEAIAMLVPNATAERLPYVPGVHRVRALALPRTMGDSGRARVRVSALVKRAPGGDVTSGAIDLDVFLVNVGVTASGAPSSSRITAALGRFETVMSRVGISLGDVRFHDVTGADATRYQVIDSTDGPDSELAGLFRLSTGLGGARLAIFLVRSINAGGSGFNTLGIAGGIPGPSQIFGSSHSGVVVAFDSSVIGASGASAGHVMAHEVSHFLGLYHVTERDRPCGAGETPPGCAPFGGTDTIGDTTRGDTTNLMNWSIVGMGSNTGLSAGQGFVMRRSAVIR